MKYRMNIWHASTDAFLSEHDCGLQMQSWTWSILCFSVALLVLIPATHAACTSESWCRNEYNPTTRQFYRNGWGLTEIPKDIPHEALEIELVENNITFLPAYVFAPFTSLELLYLYRNKISNIDANAFAGLIALKSLSLTSNRLTEFPTEMLTPLESLNYLDLRFNPFHPFSPGKFASLTSLEWLHLYMNDLGIVYPGTFSGLVSLKKLVLAGNSLFSLPPGIFAELRSLEELYLGGNNFTRLDPDWFIGLGKLKKLALYDNYLTSLSPGDFGHMPSLEALDIAVNNLTTIGSDVLSGLDHLRTISLGGNNMATLYPQDFVNLPRPFKLSMKNMWEALQKSSTEWECSTLCWLRDEERKGTVRLVHWTLGYHVMGDDSSLPFCAEEGEWAAMECAQEGESPSKIWPSIKIYLREKNIILMKQGKNREMSIPSFSKVSNVTGHIIFGS